MSFVTRSTGHLSAGESKLTFRKSGTDPTTGSRIKYLSGMRSKRKLHLRCDNWAMQIGIVAHHTRADMAHDLVTRLEAEVCLVDQYGPGSLQDGVRRCSFNHLKVLSELQALAANDEWCVVLEDDSIPVPGFRTHAARALECAPSPLVGFYLGQGIPSGIVQRNIRQALDDAQAWIVADCFLTSVGYAIKASLVGDLISDAERRNSEIPMRITRWSHERDILISYTNPSLVDHSDTDSVICAGVPLADRGTLPRVAWSHGTRNNWNTPAVRLGHCPNWSPEKTAMNLLEDTSHGFAEVLKQSF